MNTGSCETALQINVVNETAEDTGDGLTFMLHGRDARTKPAPTVYVDGAEAAPSDYVFDAGDDETAATITFNESQSGKTVTCDYVWRLACSPENDLTVYEFGREANVRTETDVNGRTIVVEGYERVAGWRGALVWDFAGQEFWEEIRLLAETPGATFALERNSLASPFNLMENLYAAGYPKFREIPGCPGRSQIAIPVVQLG